MHIVSHFRRYHQQRPLHLLFAAEETRSGYGSAGDEPETAPMDSDEPETAPMESDEPETAADWTHVHARIVEIGAERAARERDLCRWLLAAERLGVAVRSGYASVREYAERTVGLTGRQTEERLRVGRALGRLPVLDDALARGELCFSAVREVTRIATADTELAWRDWAKGKTTRQIDKAIASRSQGDGPDDRPDPSRIKHRLSFKVRAETMALFRDLQAAVRADLGGDRDVDDDMLLAEIARRALGGPSDEGRASYQIAVKRCDACQLVSIDAGGESYPVDEVTAERIACDSQEIGTVDGSASPRAGGEAPSPAKRRRATQTVPPATRRQVVRRDNGVCRVDGCANSRYLDIHHVDPRNEGGSHDPSRLLLVCGRHHAAVHAGTLSIDGTAESGFTFRHADGTRYGEALRPHAIEVAQQVFSALRHMGFKETQARKLIDAVQRAGAPNDLEAFLRAALHGA